MCKTRPGIKRFCIKPRTQCYFMMTYITKLGLDIRQVFIYTNSLDTIRSWLDLMFCDPYLVALRASTDAEWFSNIFPYMRNIFRYHFMQRTKDNLIHLPKDAST